MTAYHQMGHDCENLLALSSQFGGAVVSPVNEREIDIHRMVKDHGGDRFEFVFDPQLYYPRGRDKGQLARWDYFPKDFDTADMSAAWWRNLVGTLSETVQALGVGAVCSPAVVPRLFDDKYYEETQKVATLLAASVKTKLRVLMTVVVRLADLTDRDRVQQIASIVTGTKARGAYLILMSDLAARREFNDPEELKGAMRLIHSLEHAGMPVLVGCTSHDMVLWKAAGATACATGKYANLRRFSPSRFMEREDDGTPQARTYWFEESLLAFIRQTDLERLNETGYELASANAEGQDILAKLKKNPADAWMKESWRQYLRAFAALEVRLAQGESVRNVIRRAEKGWAFLEDNDLFMEEPRNDGSWIRPWLRALVEFQK